MRRILSIALIIFMGLPGISFGQSVQEAVEALKRLESRVTIGIPYKDYMAVLGEVSHVVNNFINSPEANKSPQLKESIRKTLVHYRAAALIWQYKFNRIGATSVPDLIDKNSDMGRELIRLYPRIVETISPSSPKWITIPDSLSIIWHEASLELNHAVKLLALQDSKLPIKPSESGKSLESTKSSGDIEARLDKIEQLRAKGKITDEEYKQMRKDILSEATKSK